MTAGRKPVLETIAWGRRPALRVIMGHGQQSLHAYCVIMGSKVCALSPHADHASSLGHSASPGQEARTAPRTPAFVGVSGARRIGERLCVGSSHLAGIVQLGSSHLAGIVQLGSSHLAGIVQLGSSRAELHAG